MARDAAATRRPDLLLLPGLICHPRRRVPVLDAPLGGIGQVAVADLSGADSMADWQA